MASLHIGQHRRQFDFHRDYLLAHRNSLATSRLGVSDVLSVSVSQVLSQDTMRA
jgi:hypothetical protein